MNYFFEQFGRVENQRPYRLLKCFIPLLAVLFGLFGCSESGGDVEAEIREWVASGELAVEERDRGELNDRIADSYQDGRGNDADALKLMIRGYLMRYSSLGLLVKVDDIVVTTDTVATVTLLVATAHGGDSILDLGANAYTVELQLSKPGREWQIISARWARPGESLR